MKKLLLLIALLTFSLSAQSQAPVRGEISAGSYENIKSTSQALNVNVSSGSLSVALSAIDPCATPGVPKSSVPIAITTAATTSLVAPSASTVIYVCGVSMTISQVVTTANIITFVTGTGATCGTGTVSQTGGYGSGGVTAAAPLSINIGYGSHTVFKSLAADRLCATTTIGASAFFAGVLTYVQQ